MIGWRNFIWQREKTNEAPSNIYEGRDAIWDSQLDQHMVELSEAESLAFSIE